MDIISKHDYHLKYSKLFNIDMFVVYNKWFGIRDGLLYSNEIHHYVYEKLIFLYIGRRLEKRKLLLKTYSYVNRRGNRFRMDTTAFLIPL